MSLQQQYDAILAIVKEHNKIILGGDPDPDVHHLDTPGFVNPEQFIINLKIAGGTTEERLRKFSTEDVLVCIGVYGAVRPMPLAKSIVQALRGTGTQESPKEENRPVPRHKANQMTANELVAAYDPSEPDGRVAERLKGMSQNQPFIVFSAGRTVDVDTTRKLLEELRQGFPARPSISVNGEDKPIYRVGELPDNYAEENPIFVGRPLRPDGTCDQTQRSWEGIPQEVRQMIRLVVTEDLVGGVSLDKAHDLVDLVMGTDPLKILRSRYKKASLKFKELSDTGNLPKLKILLGNRKEVIPGVGPPFGKGKKVVPAFTFNNGPLGHIFVFDALQQKWINTSTNTGGYTR
jgi:hypothetical protein